MILVPVTGYKCSGKTTLLKQLATLNDEDYVIRTLEHGRNDMLELVRELVELENANPNFAAVFECHFSLNFYRRLANAFRDAHWLIVWLGTPPNVCANRIAVKKAAAHRLFAYEDFTAACIRTQQEVGEAVEKFNLRLCEIPYTLNATASVKRLRQYVRSAFDMTKAGSVLTSNEGEIDGKSI